MGAWFATPGRRGAPATRVRGAALAAVAPLVLAGCSLLLESSEATFSDGGTDDAGFDDPFAFASLDAYLKASNTDPGDQFGGASLAFDGDRLAIGSAKEASAIGGDDPEPDDDEAAGAGAVYLYERGSRGWSVGGYLKPADPRANAGFEVVSLAGDRLAVGAPARIGDAAGRVYLFEHEAGGWRQAGDALTAPEPKDGDEFGATLALSGDTLVVGSPGAEAVHVFLRVADGSWQLAQSLVGESPGFAARFGASLGLSGDTLAVGAPHESSATSVSPCSDFEWRGGGGAVYLFEREADEWTSAGRITPVEIDLGASFGAALAFSGETLAIGAPFEEPSVLAPGTTADMVCSSGVVHVHVRRDGEWSEETELRSVNAGFGDRFGTSLALDGDRLVVGAPFEDSSPGAPFEDALVESGAVYGFERDADGWAPAGGAGMLKAANADALDLFGAAVALHGDRVAVGALDEDSAATGVDGDDADDSASGAGAAYVFSWDR